MAVYRRGRRRYVLVLLVLSSVTVITLDLRGQGGDVFDAARRMAQDAYAPIEDAANSVFSPVGDFIDGITRSGSLKSENQRLRRRVQQLEGGLARTSGLDRENRLLRKLLDIGFADNIPGVAAQVVSFAPGNFEWTVVVDRGSKDGVEEGMPVVSGEGLVGRVVDVSSRRAKVLLLTDPRMAVGVRLASSGETGVTQGLGGKDVVELDLIDPGVDVGPDELVVTSGLQQGRFPAGVPVGTVASASKRPGALQQDVRIKLLADLGRLEFVEILFWKGGG